MSIKFGAVRLSVTAVLLGLTALLALACGGEATPTANGNPTPGLVAAPTDTPSSAPSIGPTVAAPAGPTPSPAQPTSPDQIANFGDTLVVEGQPGLNLTLLSWQESDWVVNGPYINDYYTFRAQPGMKFINVQYRFTNAGSDEQSTPYLNAGVLAIASQESSYSVWAPLDGIDAAAYTPHPATDDEIKALGGDEGAFETLLPGESVTGRLIFEVPESAVPLEARIPGLAGPFSFAEGSVRAAGVSTGL